MALNNSPLLRLPAELRDLVYEFAFMTDADHGREILLPTEDAYFACRKPAVRSAWYNAFGNDSDSLLLARSQIRTDAPTPTWYDPSGGPSKSLLLACRQIYHEGRVFQRDAHHRYWSTGKFTLHCTYPKAPPLGWPECIALHDKQDLDRITSFVFTHPVSDGLNARWELHAGREAYWTKLHCRGVSPVPLNPHATPRLKTFRAIAGRKVFQDVPGNDPAADFEGDAIPVSEQIRVMVTDWIIMWPGFETI